MKWKPILLLVVFLFVFNRIGVKKKKVDKNAIREALLAVGFPAARVNLFVAQAAFESGGLDFNSPVNIADNNFSGIKYNSITDGWKKVTHATPGSISSEGDPYARFPTVKDWAKCFEGFLSYNAKPILASTPTDLALRLKANGYYESDPIAYASGVDRFYKQIS